jgi:hypothetical protein
LSSGSINSSGIARAGVLAGRFDPGYVEQRMRIAPSEETVPEMYIKQSVWKPGQP